jgi:hypothetical protein
MAQDTPPGSPQILRRPGPNTDRPQLSEDIADIVDEVKYRMDFWSDFDYQHATFSGNQGALSKQNKQYMPGKSGAVHIPRTSDHGTVHSGHAVRQMNVKNHSGAAGAGAKLLHSVSLFANRAAIIESVKWDIALQLGKLIRRIAPPAGQGGVLVSYAVYYSKHRDPMGTTVGSYAHQFALLGTGKTSTEPYSRAMSGPTSISKSDPSANPRTRVPPSEQPSQKVICFLWVFRVD